MKAALATVARAGALAVENLARRIARETPSLAQLFPEQLEKLAPVVIGQRLVRDLDRKADLVDIDFQAEREAFLGQAGMTRNSNTHKAYTAGLDTRQPFAEKSDAAMAVRLHRMAERLVSRGEISAAYSAHDPRHLFAVTEYRTDRDLHRVSKLLGHASIQVTEIYLRVLGEVD